MANRFLFSVLGLSSSYLEAESSLRIWLRNRW